MARARRIRRSPARYVAALVAAAGAHALGLWCAVLLAEVAATDPTWRSPVPWASQNSGGGATGRARPSSAPPIEIRTLDEEGKSPSLRAEELVEQLSRLDDKSAEEQKREEEQKRREEDTKNVGQVVDLARPTIEEHPDHARFSSVYDSRVEHETRGPVAHDHAGARFEIKGGEAARLGSTQPQREASAAAGAPGPPALRKAGKRAETRQTEPRPGALGQDGSAEDLTRDGTLRRKGIPGLPGAEPSSKGPREGGSGGNAPVERLGRGQGGEGGKGGPRLSASEEMLNRAIERGSGSSDYLENVDDGESTALNAKRFKYATFFNRVHDAVDQNWFAAELFVRRDPTGNIYGTRERATIVRVHLRPDGGLQSVTMLVSSGAAFLDDEAMEAIRRAAPFVHPPAQLVEADGLIHFNFGFFVDAGDRPKVKIFRYR